MTTDREHLAALVSAVERLAVDGHEHLRRQAANARAYLDHEPEHDCSAEVARASRAAYAAGQARGAGAST